MKSELEQLILAQTGASRIVSYDTLQSLWSGYGDILQVVLEGSDHTSVIVKQVKLPEGVQHPRGWHTAVGHQRKLQSYGVEWHWYRYYAGLCGESCRVPKFIYAQQTDLERVLIMEDLSEHYPVLLEDAGLPIVRTVLRWLAHFHARFMFSAGDGLWPVGSYWHLATRPEEWARMQDKALKNAAGKIDLLLSSAHYQTLLHGDAKLANFCFSEDGSNVAAVDFQYVGRGCGMKDVVYLFTSALDSDQCSQVEQALLDYYFRELREALAAHGEIVDFDALEQEWRVLYDVAWADFHRFLDGWSPEHWKINAHMQEKTAALLPRLLSGEL